MFDLSTDEFESFDGGFCRSTWINGPITLVRFSNSMSGEQGRLGRFWLYGDYVHSLLATGVHSTLRLIGDISNHWAICDDWGDKQLMTLMDVPQTGRVPAIWGKTKCQPKVSDNGQRQTRHSYQGGALQLIIPLIYAEWRHNDPSKKWDPNPGLTRFVTRRLRTSDLLSRPGLLIENPWVTAQRKAGCNI